MTGPERGKYMKDVVMPKMKTAFQDFDKDEFGKFGCDTCHGKQAKARKFKMPNPDIYALPSTPAGFAPLMEKQPKMLKFMGEVVKPQMAALLGCRNTTTPSRKAAASAAWAATPPRRSDGPARHGGPGRPPSPETRYRGRSVV
jgi:hypothetical protein